MTEIKQLEEQITYYRDLYYNGTTERQELEGITDAEYDLLEERLRELDPNNALFSEVGATSSENRERLSAPMLSQEKALTPADSNRLLSRFPLGEKMVITEKLDGCGLDITYRDGRLVSAVTRGTWIEGTQVLKQAECITNIPKTISHPSLFKEVHIRGEVVIKLTDFTALNEEQVRRGEQEFSNSRNLAAGTIKLADLSEVRRRKLFFVAYEAFAGSNLYSMPAAIESGYSNKIQFLQSMGFDIPESYSVVYNTPEARIVDEAYSLMEHCKYPYAIDGIVVKMDDLEAGEVLGATSHHPRNSFAIKPKPEAVWVTVDHIDWTLSRRGTLTPTAVFNPTEISGAMISRVNLHNLNNMAKLNATKGTRLKIIRSGLVIPRAVASDMGADSTEGDNKKVLVVGGKKYYYYSNLWRRELPETDPSTGAPVYETELSKGGARVLKVEESRNYFVVAKKIEHFLKAIRALGWGETLLVEFCKNTGVLTVSDFLQSVDKETILKSMTSVGLEYADKLSNSVRDALKAADKVAVIKGLGIDHAQSVVEKVVDDFHSAADVLNENIWRKHVTDGVYKYIKRSLAENKEEFEKILSQVSLDFSKKEDINRSTTFSGKSFVITGTLTKPRKEFETIIKNNGGTLQSAISSRTSFLLAGNGGGSKRTKAEELGVQVISEEEFMKMLVNK